MIARPVGSWLERFRRSAAVPAAASDDLAAELLPVFAALDGIAAEAQRLHDRAEAEAERRRAAAVAETARIEQRARALAEAERARAEAESLAARLDEMHAIEAAARRQATLIRERGRRRIPALVEEVLASLTEEPS